VDNKPNVWRSVFDPGSNPNTKNVGASYYDTVKVRERFTDQQPRRPASSGAGTLVLVRQAYKLSTPSICTSPRPDPCLGCHMSLQ
jgi:hypothetical protein